MTVEKTSILVLGAGERSALAVTRSLGKLPNVRVVTSDHTDTALASASKYSSEYIKSPDASIDSKAYIDWLTNLQRQRQFAVILPVTEVLSQLILRHGEPELKSFAPLETVMALADKGLLFEKARNLGIRCPEFTLYKHPSDVDVSSLSFPQVLKPCLSRVFHNGEWVSTRVKVINSARQLEAEFQNSNYLSHTSFMLQEFISGSGAGVSCLYRKGEPRAFFAHRRVREKPPEGGVSVVSESIALEGEMKDAAVKILNSVKWHGVAMVEFKIDPQGVPYLMEVNTRFWGSLQLAIDSGVDFPVLLLGSISGEDGSGAVVENYEVGRKLRWFLGDLDSLYLYLRGCHSIASKLRRICTFILPQGRCRHEINRFSDFKPALIEFRNYLRAFFAS